MEWVLLALAVIAVIWLAAIFNKLVQFKRENENAFSQIEVQLKRRYDLIPNLVATAQGYMKHERETLESVIQARNEAASALKNVTANMGDAAAMSQLSMAEGALQKAMGGFNMVMEAYPDLKASQNVSQLSEELVTTENKVAFARQAFNDSVTTYNIYKGSVPAIFFAGLFGHAADAKQLEFEDSAAIQHAPKVEL